MDVALADNVKGPLKRGNLVSILVVMDVALAVRLLRLQNQVKLSLNPCCNGCCSRRSVEYTNAKKVFCLNPCCNGCCSRRLAAPVVPAAPIAVSILVVMDVALAEALANGNATQRKGSQSLL